MSLISVQTADEFDRVLTSREGSVVVGFFGDFSQASRKADADIRKFCEENPDVAVLRVEVDKIKGIHKRFGVGSVPTVLNLDKGNVVQMVVGPQGPDVYARAFLQHASFQSGGEGGKGPTFPPVTVYVSDTCVWCTRVKSYLRKRRVPFSEVNVSRDPSAAQSLMARTGQTGVPQLDIAGKYVVGFDKSRIDSLLGLQPEQADA